MSRVSGGKLSGGLLISSSVALFAGAILYAIFNDMDYGLSVAVAVTLVLVLVLYIIVLPVRKISHHIREDGGWVEYRIQPGETLTQIAQVNKVAWRKLAKVNHLRAPYDLETGSVLRVPPKPSGTKIPKVTIEGPDETEKAELEEQSEIPETIEEQALEDTRGLDEPNMLEEMDEPESVEEIFEDDIPQEEIAAELAHKPKAKSKPLPKKKSTSKKIAVKPKK